MGLFRNWNDNGQISLPNSDILREAPFLVSTYLVSCRSCSKSLSDALNSFLLQARDLARHVGKTFSSVYGRLGSGGYEPV